MGDHQLEGESLGKIAELFTVAGADQRMQLLPPGRLLFLHLQRLQPLLLLLPLIGMLLQLLPDST